MAKGTQLGFKTEPMEPRLAIPKHNFRAREGGKMQEHEGPKRGEEGERESGRKGRMGGDE